MRSIATCYSEHAIRVSDSYCSGPSSDSVRSYRSPVLSRSSSPGPAEITCTYRANISSGKQLLISLTWRSSFLRQGLIINFSDQTSREFPASGSPRWLHKAKGSRSFQCAGSSIDVSWDLTYARFNGGPEPVSGFYVSVQADSEVVLLLGDSSDEDEDEEPLPHEKRPNAKAEKLEPALISRSEQFIGGSVYSTKAKFGGARTSQDHDVLIKFGRGGEGDDRGYTSPVLSVFIDGKRMFQVQRLRWNFRGNQSIFVDGLVIDMMWDVHDWFFGQGTGCAAFMLRTRSGLDSRLWLEEKNLQGNGMEKVEFSLLICASNCNSSTK